MLSVVIQRSRGTGLLSPLRYGEKNAPGYRRARACPSPCLDPIKDLSSGACSRTGQEQALLTYRGGHVLP